MDGKTAYALAKKYATEKQGAAVVVDRALNASSSNPVANSAATGAINGLIGELDGLKDELDGVKDKANVPVALNVSIPLASGITCREYFRYSKYGRIVVIDIGGIGATSTGNFTVAEGGMPVMRSRPVCVLSMDSNTAYAPRVAYGDINGQKIRAYMDKGVTYYGTMVYLTD